MDRPDAGPARRAGRASSASATFPTFGDGENLDRVGGERRAATAARSRSSRPPVLADFAQAAAAARPDGAQRCRPTRRGRRRRRARAGTRQTFRHVDAPQPAHARRPGADGDRRDRGASGRASRPTSRCCTSSSTSPPRRVREADLDRGRRAAGPLRRRLAARSRSRLAEQLGGRLVLAPGARDRVDGDGVVIADGRPGARARDRRACRRRWPGASTTSRRCPGCATSSPSALPKGAVIKCHAVYDEPFWRGDGLSGQAGSRRRARRR